MKKITKALIGGAVAGTTLTAIAFAVYKVVCETLKLDPDAIYISDEEAKKIEKQSRHCRCRADNVSEEAPIEKTTEIKVDIKPTMVLNFDGSHFYNEHNVKLSDEEATKFFNDNSCVFINVEDAIKNKYGEDDLKAAIDFFNYNYTLEDYNPVKHLKSFFESESLVSNET